MLDVQVLWSAADAPPETDHLLTDPERGRLRALRSPEERDLFRSAHVLGRLAVGRLLHVEPSSVRLQQRCPRCGGPHGRPVARMPGRAMPGVSLSRAGGVVLAAAAFAEIGVDHEPRGFARPGVADVALADTERAQLALLPVAERGDAVLRWWVRKEAVLKMTGHGLLIDPSLIVVSAPSEPPQLVAWHGPGRRPQVQLADLELDGAAAAVAARTRSMLRVHLARTSLSQLAW